MVIKQECFFLVDVAWTYTAGVTAKVLIFRFFLGSPKSRSVFYIFNCSKREIVGGSSNAPDFRFTLLLPVRAPRCAYVGKHGLIVPLLAIIEAHVNWTQIQMCFCSCERAVTHNRTNKMCLDFNHILSIFSVAELPSVRTPRFACITGG